jgi:Flp pilus assembly protein TadG
MKSVNPGKQLPKRCKRHRRRGAAAVELATILPLFVTLVLGCADFARFAYTYIALSNAVRAGAGWAIMNKPSSLTNPPASWQTSVQTAVSNEMSLQPGFQSSSLTVPNASVTTESTTYGTTTYNTWRVTVTATYPFTSLVNWNFSMLGHTLGLPHSLTLGQTVTMRGIR